MQGKPRDDLTEPENYLVLQWELIQLFHRLLKTYTWPFTMVMAAQGSDS